MDISTMYNFVKQTVLTAKDVNQGMKHLESYCINKLGTNSLEKLSLDLDTDLNHLQKWLTNLLKNEPPPKNIRAFWFGLYNPYLDDGEPTCQLYMSGSSEFDPEDRAGTWAMWNETSYTPDERYANSHVLTKLYRATQLTDAEFILCLGYAALAINHFCTTIPTEILLGECKKIVFAVGYDSGELIVLGELTKDGFHNPY